MNIKPLLAVQVTDWDNLTFPKLASPKLDGFRCLTIPCVGGIFKCQAVSRSLKPIRNAYIRNWMETNLPAGFDGELMVMNAAGKPLEFNEISSVVTKREHPLEKNFQFWCFDFVGDGVDGAFGSCRKAPFHLRLQELKFRKEMQLPQMKFVEHVELKDNDELDAFEAKCLAAGFEGVMLRKPDGIYKLGRSTELEAILLKVKRFAQDEAWVVARYEEMENTNEKTTDALGHATRSNHKAGMRGKGTLGGLVLKPMKYGKPTPTEAFEIGKAIEEDRLDAYLAKSKTMFKCGSGFNAAQRVSYFKSDLNWMEIVATYKHQESGAKKGGKPRFPIWKGFRSVEDL